MTNLENKNTKELLTIQYSLSSLCEKKINGLQKYHAKIKYLKILDIIQKRWFSTKIGTLSLQRVLYNDPDQKFAIKEKINFIENGKVETGIIDQIVDNIYFIKRF